MFSSGQIQYHVLCHIVLSVKQFLPNKHITTRQQLSYFPDLATGNYFLFSKVKSMFKETHFESFDAVIGRGFKALDSN